MPLACTRSTFVSSNLDDGIIPRGDFLGDLLGDHLALSLIVLAFAFASMVLKSSMCCFVSAANFVGDFSLEIG